MTRQLLAPLALGLFIAAGAAPASGLLPVDAGLAHLAEPEVFSGDGLAADRARAAQEGKIHVIYATATWCPPCKKMKAETWVDDGVVEWLEANAVVTPLDVDRSQSDAARLRVRAMPTIMAFDGTTEIARTVGYQAPSPFRAWLESSTGRGMPADDGGEAEQRVTRAGVQERLAEAQGALSAGELDAATEHLGWLWDHMRQDRAANELRRGGLAEQIGSLIARHEPARDAFATRRDAIGAGLPPADADEATLLDWIALNGVLGDDAMTVRWAAGALDDRQSLAFMRRHQQILRPVLAGAGRWNEAAAVVNNPFSAARLELMRLKQAQRETGESGIDAPTLDALADLYAIAHTIDRAGFAERVASLVLRTDDTPAVRRALVSRAIQAGSTDPSLAELIAEDGSDEAQSLRDRLDG